MNNNSKSNDDLLSNYTQISGACVRHSASFGEPPVSFNPKLLSPPVYYQKQISNPEAVSAKKFTEEDFRAFAEKLKLAGQAIHKAAPDIVLVPRRGGVRLWEHLRIYCNIKLEQSVLFPFTAGEKFSDETREIIDGALSPFLGREKVSIVCIDAAEGGQGSARLVEILKHLHARDPRSHWTISLCLFVPKEREHAQWRQARERASGTNFRVSATLFAVKEVIGEDKDYMMISLENFGPVRKIVTTVQGVHYLIESAELPAVIDQKILEATHKSLLAEPFTTVIDIGLWHGDHYGGPERAK